MTRIVRHLTLEMATGLLTHEMLMEADGAKKILYRTHDLQRGSRAGIITEFTNNKII